MYPELFGGVAAGTLFLSCGILIGATVAMYGARRAGFEWWRFFPVMLFLAVAGLLGAKAYGLIERGGIVLPLSAEIVSGYRYPGGVIAIAAAVWALGRWTRFSAGALADVIAPCFGFAMSVARIGCLLAGCCSGTVTTVPWAIRFPAHSQPWTVHVAAGILAPTASETLPVHPLQLYFALLALALGCFCLWFERRKAYDGQVFLAYVTLYGIGQFLLEFLRFTPLPHVQYMAVTIALVAGVLFLARTPHPALSRSVA